MYSTKFVERDVRFIKICEKTHHSAVDPCDFYANSFNLLPLENMGFTRPFFSQGGHREMGVEVVGHTLTFLAEVIRL